MTDVNSNYSMDHFIEDVQRIMSSRNNRSSILEHIEPLLKRVMLRDDLLQESLKTKMGDGKYSYTFFTTEDESLAITAPAFLPSRPTSVHDHLTWVGYSSLFRSAENNALPENRPWRVRRNCRVGALF